MVDRGPVGVMVAPASFEGDEVSEGLSESLEVLLAGLSDPLPEVPDVDAGLSEAWVDPGVAAGGVEAEAELVAGLSEAELPVGEFFPVVGAALEACLVSGELGAICASEAEIKKKYERRKR